MADMKFKADAAWNDAIALLRTNREIAGAIAGIFLFLPLLAAGLLATPMDMAAMSKADPVARVAALGAFLRANWGWFVLILLCSWMAALAINVHVMDRARPTLAEALKIAIGLLPYYVVAQLLSLSVIFFEIIVITLPGAFVPQALAGLLSIIALMGALTMAIGWSPLGTVIAVERITGPIQSLKRSWQLTKGQKRRFGIFLIFVVAMTYILQVIFRILLSLPFLLLPPDIKMVGMSLVSAFVGATASIFVLFILLASYKQLAAIASPKLAE